MIDLAYHTLRLSVGKRRPRAAGGNVGGDDEFSDGHRSPVLQAIDQRLTEYYFDDFVEGYMGPD